MTSLSTASSVSLVDRQPRDRVSPYWRHCTAFTARTYLHVFLRVCVANKGRGQHFENCVDSGSSWEKVFFQSMQGAVAAQSNHVCFAVAGRKTSSVCLTTNNLNLNRWIIFRAPQKYQFIWLCTVDTWLNGKATKWILLRTQPVSGLNKKTKPISPPQKNKISSLYTIQIYTMQPSATPAALLDKQCSRFLDPAMCPPQSTSLMCLDVDKAWVQLWWL